MADSLGWGERGAIAGELARSFPWIDAAWTADSPSVCRNAQGDLEAEIEFEPHLVGPRWRLYWTITCIRTGWRAWDCADPIEGTLVRLASDDRGSLVFDGVPVDDALAALAAVLDASRAGELLDPFDGEDLPTMLAPDDLLSVSREPFCGGLLVTANVPGDPALLQLCVETQGCEPGRPCRREVSLQGKTG